MKPRWAVMAKWKGYKGKKRETLIDSFVFRMSANRTRRRLQRVNGYAGIKYVVERL